MNSGEKPKHSKGEDRKRLEDQEFLDRVKTASPEELETMLKNHRHPDAPAWKKAAISRAFLKLSRRP